MINKNILNRYKYLIRGSKIKVGEKIFYFEGAGPVKVKFSTRITGLDVTQASKTDIWVRYENLNPVIEEELIKLLRINGVEI